MQTEIDSSTNNENASGTDSTADAGHSLELSDSAIFEAAGTEVNMEVNLTVEQALKNIELTSAVGAGIEISNVPVIGMNHHFHDPAELSLPAALCDEALLKEIESIPNKMGFKIGEVADMLGIKQYVLRYWESEFDVLKPKKAPNNQRYYTRRDVENAYIIRKLLHRDRFSIEGARAALRDVKQFVKKEKDWQNLNKKVDSLQDRIQMNLDHLLGDIRNLKRLFRA